MTAAPQARQARTSSSRRCSKGRPPSPGKIDWMFSSARERTSGSRRIRSVDTSPENSSWPATPWLAARARTASSRPGCFRSQLMRMGLLRSIWNAWDSLGQAASVRSWLRYSVPSSAARTSTSRASAPDRRAWEINSRELSGVPSQPEWAVISVFMEYPFF